MIRHSIRLLAASLLIAAPVYAQRGGGGNAPTTNTQTDTLSDVSWRNIGPNDAGRMVAQSGSDARPDEYYFGTTGGGVWKTTDAGKTLVPVTDAYFGGTIGAVAVAPSNPDVVYAGGGETPIRGNVSYGDGMWKTIDGGKTWTFIGLGDTQQISRIKVDPSNPDVVYVAALGHVWGPNADRGVFKTTDGGKTWKKILFRNDSTGAIDLVMDPKDPKTLYAALWQAGRKPWLLISGGEGGGIFKTTDGGENWTEITRNPGLPSGLIGNIGLAVSGVDSKQLWAVIENEPGGGVYKSSNGGATWTFLSGDRNVRQRAWYFNKVFASPVDSNVLYSPNVGMMKSTDGGKTWRTASDVGGGGDHHDMWFSTDGKRVATTDDQGGNVTTNGVNARLAAPTGQFYHVHLTNHAPYHVCGAKQDAGSLCGPVRGPIPVPGGGGRGGGGAAPAPAPTSGYQDFYSVAGGESGYIASEPTNPDITFGGNYSGNIATRDRISGRSFRLDPWPLNPMGHDAKDSKYRFQWTFPIMNSPHDPHTLLVGSNVVFKSTNDGRDWTIISPDLTRHDPRTLGASGGPISKDQTSVEYYATVFALAESPLKQGLIWAGSDDGLINVTRNGGVTWANVTPKGLPEWMRMSIIDPSPHEPGTAWVAANRYQLDDKHPYLYRTQDYGVTWEKITEGIPDSEFTRSIREDLVRPGMLYAATERSMYLSYDWGRHWQSLKKNLPPVPVHDIALRDDDMAIATHGRAFWVMENLDVLRNGPEAAAAKAASKDYLYQPPSTPRANGVLNVRYWLAQAGDPITIELVDRKNPSRVIKKVSSTDTLPTPPAAGGGGGGGGRGGFGGPTPAKVPTAQGMNRYLFNLRYPNASQFNGMILWQGNLQGPTIAPGEYLLRVRSGTKPPMTKMVRITRDPRTEGTDADIAEQVDLALKTRDRVTDANDGVKTIRSIKRQLTERESAMAGNNTFATLAKTFRDSLSSVEDSLYQTKNEAGEDPLNFPIRINNQFAALLSIVNGGERRPPKQWFDVYNTLMVRFTPQMARLHYVTDVMLPRVNRALTAAGQAEIVPTTVEPPAPAGGRGGGGGRFGN